MGATDLSVLPQRSVVFPETVFRGLAPADVPLRVEGVVSQTGNLTEWRDGAGSVRTVIGPRGNIGAGLFSLDPDGSTDNATGIIIAASAASRGLLVRGAAGQTAKLQEWQNSGSTTLAGIRNDGYFMGLGLLTAADTGPYLAVTSNSVLAINRTAATNPVLRVQGMTSQTGNLQDWINSAGAIQAAVSSGGTIITHSTMPLVFNGGGAGTFTQTAFYSNTNGLLIDLGRETDVSTAAVKPFEINARGGGAQRLLITSAGDVVIQSGLHVIANAGLQGADGVNGWLKVGNDSRFYDCNVANAIALRGEANPEAATLYLGRVSGGAPSLNGNDVNKTLVLIPSGSSYDQGQVVTRGSLYCYRTDASSNPSAQLHIGGSNTTSGNTSQHNGWMRWLGNGIKHAEITWHPGESYFRFRTSAGSDFDGWAFLLANQFYAQSTEASKENIQTLDIGGYSGVKEIRREAKTAAPSKPLTERFRSLRPVSYRSKGDPNSPLLHSFVAEEAFDVVPEIVAIDGEGKPTGINLMATISILTAMVQEQQTKIEALEARL